MKPPAAVMDKAAAWGNLPETERQKILQGLRETYPQEYVDYIEKYLKQLSEGGR